MRTLEQQTKRAAVFCAVLGFVLIVLALLPGCGGSNASAPAPTPPTAQPDDSVVHGMAMVTVTSDQQSAFFRMFNSIMPSAYAASGSTTVTYVNSPNTTFTIDVSQLTPGLITNNTLSLGSVSISALSDNNLKVCNPGGNSKCTQAIIRVYNTGTLAGFVNTADSYAAPVYAGSLNPSTPLGLNSAGSVQVQTLTIASTTHKLTLSNFPSPTYNVDSDFSNAGAGSYSMTLVVEYALAP